MLSPRCTDDRARRVESKPAEKPDEPENAASVQLRSHDPSRDDVVSLARGPGSWASARALAPGQPRPPRPPATRSG